MVNKFVIFLVMMAFALVNAHAANYLLKYMLHLNICTSAISDTDNRVEIYY